MGGIRSHLSSGAGFVQASMDYMGFLAEMITLSPAAAIVWCWLVKRSDRRNVVRFIESDLITATKVSRASLFRSLRLLEHNRWLGREGGEIHLNAKLVWRGKHEHIGMAKCLETVGHVRPLPPKAAKEEDRQEGVA